MTEKGKTMIEKKLTADLDYKAEYDRLLETHKKVCAEYSDLLHNHESLKSEFCRLRAQMDIVYLIFGGNR